MDTLFKQTVNFNVSLDVEIDGETEEFLKDLRKRLISGLYSGFFSLSTEIASSAGDDFDHIQIGEPVILTGFRND